MAGPSRILWADDEIDLLKPHILFLESKGYEVVSVTNGEDAVQQVLNASFDVVLLDEHMPGMGGLEAVSEIRGISPDLPVVMVTKSEEERLMEQALGGQIADYLTKPVNPSQVLLTCKRILDQSRIRSERISRDYLQSFSEISRRLLEPLDHREWIDLYQTLLRFDFELEGDESVRQVLTDQYQDANRAFSQFVAYQYPDWIRSKRVDAGGERPVLSHEVFSTFVAPLLKKDRPVVFFVIDCMRYDQWLEFESLLLPMFSMEKQFQYSILPTATPYSRNAIFSGMLPRELASKYASFWASGQDDEHSRNRNEAELLADQLKKIAPDTRIKYHKLITTSDGREFTSNVHDLLQADLSAVVVNFVDILAHSRSDSDVLRELAPDERAYRALTRTWFEHSWLFNAFVQLSEMDCTIVITTDHGAIRSLRATRVVGDRETSTALRYKFGRSLKCDERHAVLVRDPADFGLPSEHLNMNYLIAKEDFYFVYPTNYNKYLNRYRDTMQHGGISMEEMILPVVTLRPK